MTPFYLIEKKISTEFTFYFWSNEMNQEKFTPIEENIKNIQK